MTQNQPELKRIAKAARSTLTTWATDPKAKTAALKRLAELLVDLRSNFERNGGPDWGGRSFQYRAAVSEIFNAADLSDTQRKEVVGLLRYHVGNELRDRLTPEELRGAGLKVASPKQRVLDSKGASKTVETAVKRLSEAVDSLESFPAGEIEGDARRAFSEALERMQGLRDEMTSSA